MITGTFVSCPRRGPGRSKLLHPAQKTGRYRRVFSGFDPEKVARYIEKRIQKLTLDRCFRHRVLVASR
jgi:hypothetical protein